MICDREALICSKLVRKLKNIETKIFVYINFYFSGKWSDCSFLVGSESNQQTLACHKIILAMASPVFETMFFGSFNQKDDPVEISDVNSDAFKVHKIFVTIFSSNHH
jgi:hypothetical protein